MSNSSNDTEYNQRAMRAIILCVLVAIAYTQFFLAPKQNAELQRQKQDQALQQPAGQVAGGTAPLATQATGAPVSVNVPSAAVSQGHPAKSEIDSAPRSVINTGNASVVITHLGARIVDYRLRDYKRELNSEEGLNLVDSSASGALPLGVYAGNASDERVVYSLASVNGAPAGSPSANLDLASGTVATLEFKGVLPTGSQIVKKLSFTGGSYLFNVDLALDRQDQSGQPVWLEWTHYYSSAKEKELRIKHSISILDSTSRLQLVPIENLPQGLQERGSNRWIALGDTHFATALVPTVTTINTLLGREGDVFISRVAGSNVGGSFHLYVGPKDYKTLEGIGNFNLERTIDLGWFSFLALPLLWLLRFLYSLFGNYGVAIIGLTLLVKGALLPLSKASFASAKKMQDLQPEIKALRERVKDPNQLNQEMFALYKRKGVNPMGGCFPVLIQIPVFLGLYNALLNAIELRHAPFAGWINDLSAPESLQLFGIGVPVMVLLMAASMVYQTWTTPNPSADPNQQKMMMIMPLVFAGMFIIFPMPAGLVLYWLVNNIISIVQQLYMRQAAKGSVYMATAMASLVIFGFGYLLTMI